MVTVNIGNWSFGVGSRSNRSRRRPLALIIVDGWGYSDELDGNAIAQAQTPNYDSIVSTFPKTLLEASGERVGLLPGTPGNSEIGHLSMGSGRVVPDYHTRISNSIRSGEFFLNPRLKQGFARLRNRGSAVHFVGQLSDGNVNSSIETLFALLRMAKEEGAKKIYVHAILDGKDVSANTADIYVEALQIKLAEIGVGELASICGRHFAMDNQGNWERTARAYTMLVHSEGERACDPVQAVRGAYLRALTDDMIPPIVLEANPGNPIGRVNENDTVIFFNHRADRISQLASAITRPSNPKSQKSFVDAISLVELEQDSNLHVAFYNNAERNVLGQVFSEHGITNCRLAETQRYPHVTYFFNGGIEAQFPGESRIVVPNDDSVKADEFAETGCLGVTQSFLGRLQQRPEEILIANFATADLLAHTGDFSRTLKAVEKIDSCLGSIIRKVREVDGVALITSDHGNCEQMADRETGELFLSHTKNPVPFHLVADGTQGMRLREDGALEDIAPTILGLLGISKPLEMTGSDLRLD